MESVRIQVVGANWRDLRRCLQAGALRLIAVIARMFRRARQRRALSRLDARLLDDIGVSAAQARWESEKPFWRE